MTDEEFDKMMDGLGSATKDKVLKAYNKTQTGLKEPGRSKTMVILAVLWATPFAFGALWFGAMALMMFVIGVVPLYVVARRSSSTQEQGN